MSKNSVESRPVQDTLIIRLQVDPGPVSPVPTGQTQELETVKGDSEGDVSNAKEVATEPSLLAAFFWKDKMISDRKLNLPLKSHMKWKCITEKTICILMTLL